jgi:hypothetical protein
MFIASEVILNMEGAVIAEETTVKIRELRGTAALSSYI